MQNAQHVYTWLTRDMANHHVKVTKKEITKANSNDSEGITTSTYPQLSLQQQGKECILSNMGYRPKGATASASAVLKMRERKAMGDAALRFHAATCKARQQSASGRVKNSCLKKIIEAVLDESTLKQDVPSFKISEWMIRNQLKKNSNDLMNSTTGPESPLASIEPYIFQIYLQKARMGQPMQQNEVISLANSLIQGTRHQEQLMHYKKKLKIQGEGLSVAGTAYWRRFMKRNNHLLDLDTGTTQAVCRKEWNNFLNISKMYNLVYNVMDEVGLIENLDSSQWMNMDSIVVDTK